MKIILLLICITLLAQRITFIKYFFYRDVLERLMASKARKICFNGQQLVKLLVKAFGTSGKTGKCPLNCYTPAEPVLVVIKIVT